MRDNINMDVRTLDYHGWISADGTSAKNLVAQINSINEQITALVNEQLTLQNAIDATTEREKKTGFDCKGAPGQHSWIDSAGVKWCGKDSDSGWRAAVQAKNEQMNRMKNIKDVLIPKLEKQLVALNATAPELAKSDPEVIAANALAQKSLSRSKNISTVFWVIGGVVLAVVASWAIIRIVRAVKK